MQWIGPDYYGAFACIAGRCRHSCCIGWEIDIDDGAMQRWRRVQGEIGARLRAGISLEGGTPHFRLDSRQRCPMLEPDGLCSMICALGPDSLCQICRDHPRYRSFFSGRTEVGLGLCCEAAAGLILRRREKTRLVVLEDDHAAEPPLTAAERSLLDSRAQLICRLQDRTRPVAERARELPLLCGGALPDRTPAWWADVFLSLERLEADWTDCLEGLRACDLRAAPPLTGPDWEIAFEQILVTFVYRHLPGALDDGAFAARAAFASLAFVMLRALCRAHYCSHGAVTPDDLVELTRRYSAEIEYSDDNTEALLELLDRA